MAADTNTTAESPMSDLALLHERADWLVTDGRYDDVIALLLPVEEHGNAETLFYLALAQMNIEMAAGIGSEPTTNMRSAIAWAERSLEQDYALSANLLATIYSMGLGVDANEQRALDYLERGDELGDPGASLNLAVRLLAEDPDNACRRLYQLSNQESLVQSVAQYHFGVSLIESDCPQTQPATDPIALLRAAGEEGVDDALVYSAELLEQGRRVQQDTKAALALYDIAARRGHARALWRMGLAYVNGDRPRDPSRAVTLFEQAADAGASDGLVSLGVMHATGDGVEKDVAAAMAYYEQAASLGNAHAMRNLSMMLWHGMDVDKQPRRALLWVEKAAALGNPEALQWRDGMRAAFDDEVLADIDALLNVWLENFVGER
ncbi:MAG: tetratricopeptide repeat protein [Pseudomonadota bacterium]